MFSCHNTDKYGYLGHFWLSQCAANKLDYFSVQRVVTQSLTFFHCLFIYVPEKISSKTLHFSSFKGDKIWTCPFRPVMSPPVEFISFAKKVAIDFCYFFFSVIDIGLIEIMKYKI